MTYYLVSDVGTQWFQYVISKNNEKIVDVFDIAELRHVNSTLFDNIYGREIMEKSLKIVDYRVCNGSNLFYGWSISRLEFDRVKRMVELYPAIQEFNKIKDSV